MDDHRLEEWFLEYSDDVYNFLVYYTRSHDVEDLTQEVFLKALKNIHRFAGLSSPKTWLFAIARRLAIDERRKKRLILPTPKEVMDRLPAPHTLPDELLLNKEEKQHLYDEINRLRQSYRDILIMRGIIGLSVDETADVLKWSRSKVNLTFHRAMKALAKAMHGTEGGLRFEQSK